MKRWMRPVPVALALVAVLAGSAAAQGGRGGQQVGQQQEQAASGLVTGRVTVAGTEAPLVNAQVLANSSVPNNFRINRCRCAKSVRASPKLGQRPSNARSSS